MSTFEHSPLFLIYWLICGCSEHGYQIIWRYEINAIPLQPKELFETLCKAKQPKAA